MPTATTETPPAAAPAVDPWALAGVAMAALVALAAVAADRRRFLHPTTA